MGESRYMWVDALHEKVRVDERVESMAVVIAIGVNPQDRREVLCVGAIAVRREEYNQLRPHSALGDKTPEEFRRRWGEVIHRPSAGLDRAAGTEHNTAVKTAME